MQFGHILLLPDRTVDGKNVRPSAEGSRILENILFKSAVSNVITVQLGWRRVFAFVSFK